MTRRIGQSKNKNISGLPLVFRLKLISLIPLKLPATRFGTSLNAGNKQTLYQGALINTRAWFYRRLIFELFAN